MTVPLQAL